MALLPIPVMKFGTAENGYNDAGYEDATAYPENPISPEAAREQMMMPLRQLQDYMNTVLLGYLKSIEPGSSGSEAIGAAPITAVAGESVYDQLVSIKALIDAVNDRITSISVSALSGILITSGNIATATILQGNMAADSIGLTQLINGSVTGGATGKMATNTITADNLTTSCVTAPKIKDKDITGLKIADATLDGRTLGVGAVNSNHMALNSVPATALIDGSVTDPKIGNRTISDTTTAVGTAAQLTAILGYLANMVKRVTGKSNWYTAPATTLEALNTKITNKVTVSTVAPSTPATNDIWIDTSTYY